MGAEDFANAYSEENGDAFMHEDEYFTGNGGYSDDVDDESADVEDVPHFVNSTPGAPAPSDPSGGFHFNFTGVRPAPVAN